MLYWALVFLVVAIIAGALGFGGIAGTRPVSPRSCSSSSCIPGHLVACGTVPQSKLTRIRVEHGATENRSPQAVFRAAGRSLQRLRPAELVWGIDRSASTGVEVSAHVSARRGESNGGQRAEGPAAAAMTGIFRTRALEFGGSLMRALRHTGISLLYQDPSLRVVWAQNVPKVWSDRELAGMTDFEFLPDGRGRAGRPRQEGRAQVRRAAEP